ncbi:MAG: SpoIIE family protein phosphatase [Rhodospirillales bacterium]|nr:SpoIIE family protein phosphatase [Rhodospirillales bacterium]
MTETVLAHHLDLIAAMSRSFATSFNLDESLRLGLSRIAEALSAEAASLFLLEGDELVCHACAGPVDITGIKISAKHGIVGRTVAEGASRMVRDVRADPDFHGGVDTTTGFVTRSILCAPLSVKDQTVGAIELINKKGGDGLFALGDLRVLEALANAAALAILNARMALAQVEQETLKRELELAATIQRSLLPEARPAPFPIAGINRPARQVSGDFYDIMPLADGRIWFCLGDVSGKGMNAALLMAKTASLFRCLGKDLGPPGQLMARLNDELCETASFGMFVTAVVGLYDPAGDRVVMANAGHEPPQLYRQGAFTAFEAEAPPLGIVPGAEFAEIELALDGGCLYVFTDGLTESSAVDGEFLGLDKVLNLIARESGRPLVERLERLVAAVERPGHPLRDDLTILAVEGSRQP